MLDTLWSEKFISALAQVSYKGQIGSDEQYKGQIKPSCLNKHSTINKTPKTSSSQKGWISNLCFEVKIECQHDIFQRIQNSTLCISCC